MGPGKGGSGSTMTDGVEGVGVGVGGITGGVVIVRVNCFWSVVK